MSPPSRLHLHALPERLATPLARGGQSLSGMASALPDRIQDDDIVVLHGRAALEAVAELRASETFPRCWVLADEEGQPDRDAALDAGADLWTPADEALADPRSFLAALSALAPATGRVLRLPGAVVSFDDRRVTRASTDVTRLTEQEARLLARLAVEPGAPVSREALLEDVWEYHPNVVSRAPDVAIRRLRLKLEVDPTTPRIVLTHAGQGWALTEHARTTEARRRPLRPADPSFVGRDADLEAIDALWAAEQGVVTLVGPPGVGKTTLARRAVLGCPWPLLQVRLGREGDARGLLPALAQALQLALDRVGDADAVTTIGRALAGRQVLVWVDPIDSVAEVLAAHLPQWREQAPEARWLLSGRRGTGLPDEALRAIAPLTPEDATRLFRQRASRGGWEERVEDHDLEALVTALDGLPLAVELAAARVPAVGLRGLMDGRGVHLDRLGSRAGRPSSSLERAVGGSLDALDPAQHAAIDGLAHWPGGATLDMVEATADLPEGASWVGDLLDGLLVRSLVTRRQTPHGPRYGLLDTIRWAVTQRRTAEDDAAGGRRMLEHVRRWKRLPDASDLVNAREARHRASTLPADDAADRLLALDALVGPSEPLGDRTRALDDVLGQDLSTAVRARVALRRAEVALVAGEEDLASRVQHLADLLDALDDPDHVEAVEVFLAKVDRTTGGQVAPRSVDLDRLAAHGRDPEVRVRAMWELARRHAEAGRWPAAHRALSHALAIDVRHGLGLQRRLHAEWARVAADAADPEEGLEHATKVIDDPEARDDLATYQLALQMRGLLYLRLGDLDRAATDLEEALALQERLGMVRRAAVTLGNLGVLYAESGDPREGRRALTRALGWHEELQHRRSATTTRLNLATLALVEGDAADARLLVEQVQADADAGGWRVQSAVATYLRGLVAAWDGADEEALACFALAWQQLDDLDLPHFAGPAAAHAAALAVDEDAERWWARAHDALDRASTDELRDTIDVLAGGRTTAPEYTPGDTQIAVAIMARRAERRATSS